MKNVFKVVITILAIISFIIGGIKVNSNTYDNTYDSTGVVIKMLNKNTVECGYYLRRQNNSPVITYYLYDGVTIYNSDMNCEVFNSLNKNDIENIIALTDDGILKAVINTKNDRINWFDFVRNESKELKELGLIK